MNKNCCRLIFNASRGWLMAVVEAGSSGCKSPTGTPRTHCRLEKFF